MSPPPTLGQPYHVVVMGATGFTGKIAAEYLARRYTPGHDQPVRWALAGRSESKLKDVAKSLGLSADDVPILLCDASNPEDVERLVQSTRVVANYAGTPFYDKALPIVDACARSATCYVDITGEVPFMRASYDRYHDKCVESGALVVHACGFDSVPTDMGAFLAARAMREAHGCQCSSLKMAWGQSDGGFSGGTLATGIELIVGGDKVPGAVEAKARGAYALDPAGAAGGPDTENNGGSIVGYDPAIPATPWTGPFVMSAVNCPVVRKTNALLDHSYGANVRVSEVQTFPSRLAAYAYVGVLGLALAVLAIPPVRSALLALGLLPKPGEGPSKAVQDAGFFRGTAVARGEGDMRDKVVRAHVNSGTIGDPGYKGTACMSVEAALCLALDRDKCSTKGGVLTPMAAMGDALVDRLTAAGMDISVEVDGQPVATTSASQ